MDKRIGSMASGTISRWVAAPNHSKKIKKTMMNSFGCSEWEVGHHLNILNNGFVDDGTRYLHYRKPEIKRLLRDCFSRIDDTYYDKTS